MSVPAHERAGTRDVGGSLNVLFDPVFEQICNLLVVELCHHGVTVAENSHVRQVYGCRVATQGVDRSGPCLTSGWISMIAVYGDLRYALHQIRVATTIGSEPFDA